VNSVERAKKFLRGLRAIGLAAVVTLALHGVGTSAQEQELHHSGARTEGVVAHPHEGTQLILTDSNNKGQASVVKGQVVVLRLPVTGGSGYSWYIANNDSSVLRPLGNPHVDKVITAQPGATGYEVFRFRAGSSGTSTLQLNYMKPWQKPVLPGKTFAVQVTVN
jgi:predicted secreted protein